MPKRNDIQTILVVGSGPLLLAKLRNLIMQELKPVLHLKKKVIELSWLTLTQLRL